MTSGGKRKGAGRPTIPANQRKSKMLYAPVTLAQRRICERVAKKAQMELVDWCRSTLFKAAGIRQEES